MGGLNVFDLDPLVSRRSVYCANSWELSTQITRLARAKDTVSTLMIIVHLYPVDTKDETKRDDVL